MSFLYPVFLIGALAAAVPIVLHLLRRDVAPEVPFSAVRLLRPGRIERTRQRRLSDLLLLAARVAALLLLAAAFARPYVAAGPDPAPLHIVALDRSFSMGAPGQFERAAALARAAIDEAARGQSVAVLAFDDRAEVIAEAGSAADARAAVDALRPGDGGTRFGPMVARAVELAGGGAATLIVITDLQRSGWEDGEPHALPGSIAVDVRAVDAPTGNLAVVRVAPGAQGIAATLRNEGAGARSGAARLLSDGRRIGSARFVVEAHAEAEVIVTGVELPRQAKLTLEIDDPEGYQADNVRHLVVETEARRRIVVMTAEDPQSGFYVLRALRAGDDGDALEVGTVPASKSAGLVEDLAGGGAVLLLGTRGLDRRAREALTSFVRAGGGLLAAAGAEVDPAVLASLLGSSGVGAAPHDAGGTVLAATDVRHPIFRPFGPLAANLGQARFTRTWRVREDGWTVAARFTDGTAALLERRSGQGTVLLFASDLDRRWNDFPLHPAFAPFTLEAVRHLLARTDRRREYLVADAPAWTGSRAGLHTGVEDGVAIAVNVDPRESSIARLTGEEFRLMAPVAAQVGGAAVHRQAQQIEGTQNLWRYGLMLMLAVLLAESAVGRGRRHV